MIPSAVMLGLLGYAIACAALVAAFFHFGVPRKKRTPLPLVAGAVVLVFVVAIGSFNGWIIETQPNYGVPG